MRHQPGYRESDRVAWPLVEWSMIGIVCGVVGFMATVAIHLASLRFGRSRRHFRVLAITALTCLILAAGGASWWPTAEPLATPEAVAVAAVLFIYGAVLFAYFIFIYIVDSSSATRILVEIEQSSGKKRTYDELTTRYRLEDKFRDILKDLQYLKAVEQQGGVFRNTAKGRRHARLVGGFRRYFGIGGHL